MRFKHTNLPIELSLPKLIRDNIPQIINKESGKVAIVRKAKDDKEYLKYVLKKIVEEAVEIQSCKSKSDFINEIGDIEELLSVLMTMKKIRHIDVVKFRKLKNKTNGDFSERLIFEGKK